MGVLHGILHLDFTAKILYAHLATIYTFMIQCFISIHNSQIHY
jgi:hypothetical protein